MTTTAALQASINGGANQTGGITALDGQTCQLSMVSTVGVAQQRYEIYSFPVGFALPSGWSLDAVSGAYYYSASTIPPIFTVTPWGKYLYRLTVGVGSNGLGLDGNGVADPALLDETCAVSILSPGGLPDVAWLEVGQFDSAKKWVGDFQRALRLLDTGLGTAVVPNTRNMIAGAGLTGGGTLAADRTFNVVANADGSIVVNADDVQLKPAYTALLNGVDKNATPGAIVLRSGSGGFAANVITANGLIVTDTGIVSASNIALTPFVETYAATVTMRGHDGGRHELTLTGNVSMLAPTTFDVGASLEVFITQGGAGSYTATWATSTNGFSFISPLTGTLLASTVGEADYFEFKHRAAPVSHWVCIHHGKYTPP